MKKIFTSIFLLTALIACEENNSKNEKRTTAENIAYNSGFENWKDINTINFTLNVTRDDKLAGKRSWSWKPKSNDVTMMTSTDTVSFNRNNLDETSKLNDAAFINDKFWLLAPYNLIWDNGTTFKEQKKTIAPISKDSLNMLTIKYGPVGGYTPGDAYDFYYDKDFMVREWVFRKSDTTVPTMTTTWEDYRDFNGLKISKMHMNKAGNFKLFFTNISVD